MTKTSPSADHEQAVVEGQEHSVEAGEHGGGGGHIALPSTPILEFGSFHVTNSSFAFLIVTVLIMALVIYSKRTFSLIPSRIQVVFEGIVEFFLPKLEAAWEDQQKAAKALAVIFTMFLVLIIANQFVFLPLVGAIVKGGSPAFRTPSTDLSFTLAIAIIMMFGAHAIALIFHPLKHIGHYTRLNLLFKAKSVKEGLMSLIDVFVGFLEMVGDLAKTASLTFRLFGNIFAGEVVVVIIQGLVAYIAPIPFIMIAIFAGVLQSLVFTLLTLNFTAAIMKPTFAHGHHE